VLGDVTIGHAACLHACTIEDACLIGMKANTLLHGKETVGPMPSFTRH